MTKRDFYFCSIALMIALIILNGAIVNYLYCADDYIRASDALGNEYLEKRSTVRYADRFIAECDRSDYGEAAAELAAEISRLEEYRIALKYRDGDFSSITMNHWVSGGKPFYEWTEEKLEEFDLTDAQAKNRIEQLQYCAERLKYAADYPRYIGYISRNGSSLLETSVLSANSYAAQNAAKTKRDFYGLENVKPTAESDLGIICLFSDHMTDFFNIVGAVIVAALFTRYKKRSEPSGSGEIFAGCLTACIGTALMYLCGGAVINGSIGLGDMSRPVQSVRTFLTCSSVMSVGTLALLRLVFKLLLCAAVYFAAVGIIMTPKRKAAVTVVAPITIVEVILYKAGGAFRTVSILSVLSSEEIFGVYGNINLLGNAVHPQTVFVPAVAATVVLSALFAAKSVAAFGLAARERAEQAYYDKISRTYDETRRIRHDIGNHLTALAVLLDNENVAEARCYLSEIASELNAQRLPVSTGRAVTDALLYSKAVAAEKDGIALKMEFKAAIGDKYSDFDLCGIFGNILDNAIEGCRKTDGEKTITLTVKRQMDMLCIFCENSCAPIKDPTLATDKPDKTAHGLGLQRIRQLAEKHGGGVEISAEDGVFRISVII